MIQLLDCSFRTLHGNYACNPLRELLLLIRLCIKNIVYRVFAWTDRRVTNWFCICICICKNVHPIIFRITLVKIWPILTIFSNWNSEKNFTPTAYRFAQLICTLLPLYRGKSKNSFSTILLIRSYVGLNIFLRISSTKKSLKSVNFVQSYSDNKRWTFLRHSGDKM